MDWWPSLIISWVVLSILFVIALFLFLWKFRGLFHWRKSLKVELKALAKQIPQADPARAKALHLMVDRCSEILYAVDLDLEQHFRDLAPYFRDLARCYHPQSEKPELEITLGRLLRCLEESTIHLDTILKRPGFGRISKLKLHHLRKTRDWYLKLKANPFVAWFLRNREKLRKLTISRLVIFPDPFSWIAYLSQHLSILLLSKYLLLDLYLFAGQLALAGYDEEERSVIQEEQPEELEGLLDELENLSQQEESKKLDPVLEEKLRELTSFQALWISPPGWKEWKTALVDGTRHIATKHFPQSDHPVEEAALGPLLERGKDWVQTLSHGQNQWGLKVLYKFRLATIFGISEWTKETAEKSIPQVLKPLAKKAWSLYGWMKWPLTVYKWVKKASPVGVAMDLGWMTAKKTARGYLFSKTFQMAVGEIEEVYKKSSRKSKEDADLRERLSEFPKVISDKPTP